MIKGAWHHIQKLNSGPQACMTSTLPTELFSQWQEYSVSDVRQSIWIQWLHPTYNVYISPVIIKMSYNYFFFETRSNQGQHTVFTMLPSLLCTLNLWRVLDSVTSRTLHSLVTGPFPCHKFQVNHFFQDTTNVFLQSFDYPLGSTKYQAVPLRGVLSLAIWLLPCLRKREEMY